MEYLFDDAAYIIPQRLFGEFIASNRDLWEQRKRTSVINTEGNVDLHYAGVKLGWDMCLTYPSQDKGENRQWLLMVLGFFLGKWKCFKIGCGDDCTTL